MIKGKTLKKRDIFDKPRGKIKLGSIDANVTITATENKFQWLRLADGGWVSAGSRQQYIKWEVVPDEDIPPTPPDVSPKTIIKGKTLTRRDIFDKPRGKTKLGSIPANVSITATENRFQWLHLRDGGWVSAGSKQQYIKWELASAPDDTQESPDDPGPVVVPPPVDPPQKIIRGKILVKRDVFNKPRGERKLGSIQADASITASENKFQWLHLIDGGWVNAGSKQQYIKWELVTEPDDSASPPSLPAPVVTPHPPAEPWPITEIKRAGRIATLLVDWQNPKWNFTPRQLQLDKDFAHPQTVTFNSVPHTMKGARIPLTDEMTDYLRKLNGDKTQEIILEPQAGWINDPTTPPTVERLTWAANHVVVKGTWMVADVEFSNVHALNCREIDLIGNFSDKDMRLVLHKYNAVDRQSNMMKLTSGRDCYTPFITDPDLNNGDMWIQSDYLEMWPELPFTLSDGTQIIEYELFGYEIYGLRADGKSTLLRDSSGFKTNWMINSPEVPV